MEYFRIRLKGSKRRRMRLSYISDEQFIQAVKNNTSMAGVMKELNLKLAGGTYACFRKRVARLQLDTSHFVGRGHLKGKNHNWGTKIPLENVLVENSSYNRVRLKSRLIKDNLLKEECAKCLLGPEWQSEKLVLHLDHINGIPNDNRLENLRLLCPNCHSQTSSYCGRNMKKPVGPKKKYIKKPQRICVSCKGPVCDKRSKTGLCKKCYINQYIPQSKIVWPPPEKVLQMVLESNFWQVGKQLGVSDNAVRKYLKRNNQAVPTRTIK